MNKETKRLTRQEAQQRHFNYYVEILMNETDEERLDLEFLQIQLAVQRMLSEDVGSIKYQFGDVQTKYIALAGGFVEKKLRKLIDETATKDDIEDIKQAIEIVEQGRVHFPANTSYLKSMLQILVSIP